MFRTDKQGTVIATSNGENITWNIEPSGDWARGYISSDEPAPYVLNTRSMIFHVATCDSAEKMSAANRKDVTDTRSSLEAQGYRGCYKCIK